MGKAIFAKYVKSLVGDSYNDDWTELESDWMGMLNGANGPDEVWKTQLWSEDWILARIQNGKVIMAIIWRGDDDMEVIGTGQIVPLDISDSLDDIHELIGIYIIDQC